MEPQLVRSVEIPERRNRPLFAMTALAVLFAFGSYSYVQTTRCAGVRRLATLTFNTEPAGAAVVSEDDDRLVCRTPCDLTVRAGVDGFRLLAPGYDETRVLVNSFAGDVRVDAVLTPASY
jgi:hypothetical protein